jgi:hypothetical protein
MCGGEMSDSGTSMIGAPNQTQTSLAASKTIPISPMRSPQHLARSQLW